MSLTGAQQTTFWRDYYNAQWQARLDFAKALIARGETQVSRILGRLEAIERTHSVGMDTVSGRSVYLRLPQQADCDYLPTGVPVFRAVAMLGHQLQLNAYATFHVADVINDYVTAHGPFDSVVELGCGYGRNLFDMLLTGAPLDADYLGGELTASGRELASELAGLMPETKPGFFAFDHVSPQPPTLKRPGRVLVFTAHSIEQVTTIGANWFEAVAGMGREVHCLHLEPFGFQIDDSGDAAKAQRAMFEAQRWNLNLFEALRAANAAGTIRLTYLAADIFIGFTAPNGTSFAVWQGGRG